MVSAPFDQTNLLICVLTLTPNAVSDSHSFCFSFYWLTRVGQNLLFSSTCRNVHKDSFTLFERRSLWPVGLRSDKLFPLVDAWTKKRSNLKSFFRGLISFVWSSRSVRPWPNVVCLLLGSSQAVATSYVLPAAFMQTIPYYIFYFSFSMLWGCFRVVFLIWFRCINDLMVDPHLQQTSDDISRLNLVKKSLNRMYVTRNVVSKLLTKFTKALLLHWLPLTSRL